jgi:hypothetical protein
MPGGIESCFVIMIMVSALCFDATGRYLETGGGYEDYGWGYAAPPMLVCQLDNIKFRFGSLVREAPENYKAWPTGHLFGE